MTLVSRCSGLLFASVVLSGCMSPQSPVLVAPVQAEPGVAAELATRGEISPAAPLSDPNLVAYYASRADGDITLPSIDTTAFHPALLRNEVAYQTSEVPGTVVIDTKGPFLYHVEGGGRAIRYGIAIGREGFGWTGEGEIARTARWPRWTPPPEMIKRDPSLEKWRDGQPGGVDNPLGARALYIYFDGHDSGFRIHGTNHPSSIGYAASSGCFRMLNQDVIDLYDHIRPGARVVVL
jgi:lipoprotein-anchoring transpeptidase ErfK/SrfK